MDAYKVRSYMYILNTRARLAHPLFAFIRRFKKFLSAFICVHLRFQIFRQKKRSLLTVFVTGSTSTWKDWPSAMTR